MYGLGCTAYITLTKLLLTLTHH